MMYWKRSLKEVEDELQKLHAAGEIDLDAWNARGTNLDETASAAEAVRDAIFRIQGFEGQGRVRACAMCGQRFWGPWIADALCSDACMEERNRRGIETMRRLRGSPAGKRRR